LLYVEYKLLFKNYLSKVFKDVLNKKTNRYDERNIGGQNYTKTK